MILVVAMHAYELHYSRWFEHGPLSGFWDVLVSAAQPIRMPLFFLISGYLCARSMKRSWKSVLHKRVVSIAYLYYVWLCIYAVASLGESVVQGTHFSLANYIQQIIWPDSSLWYLYGLVIYFCLARVTFKVPLWIVLPLAAALSVAGTSFFGGTAEYITRSFLFFILGCRLSPLILGIVSRARWPRIVAILGLYSVACLLTLQLGPETLGLLTLASVTGVYLALQFSSLIGPLNASKPFRFVGRNTLAIFVLHPVLLKGINLLFAKVDAVPTWIGSHHLLAASYPLLITSILLIMSLLVENLLRRAGGRFLFEMPRILKSRTP